MGCFVWKCDLSCLVASYELIKSRTLKLTPAPGIFPGISSKDKYSSSLALVVGDTLIIIRVERSRVSTRATQRTVWHANAMLESEIGRTPGEFHSSTFHGFQIHGVIGKDSRSRLKMIPGRLSSLQWIVHPLTRPANCAPINRILSHSARCIAIHGYSRLSARDTSKFPCGHRIASSHFVR
jgi:hypothetical protein